MTISRRVQDYRQLETLLSRTYDTRRHVDLLEAAVAYSEAAHAGERFDFVKGATYITHVRSVADRMHTPAQKVTAFFHDTIEARVERLLGKKPSREDEERVIHDTRMEIIYYMGWCGHDVTGHMRHVDQLTRRRAVPLPYPQHIDVDIIGYARATGDTTVVTVKMADSDDNYRADRNPRLRNQTAKDIARIARTLAAREAMNAAYPLQTHAHVHPRTLPDDDQQKEGHGRPHDRRRSQAERSRWVDTDGPPRR